MDNEQIASNFLFVDLAIKNLERDLQIIQSSSLKIKEPYIQFTSSLLSNAINERKKLKQLMYKNKLQVEYVGKQGDFVLYKFYLDGYVKEVTFHRTVIRKNVEEVIKELQ